MNQIHYPKAKITLPFGLLILILIGSCSPSPKPTNTVTQINKIPVSTVLPESIETTQHQFKVTPHFTETPNKIPWTLQDIPIFDLSSEQISLCLEGNFSDLTNSSTIDGKIFLFRLDGNELYSLQYPFKVLERIQLPDQRINSFSFSNDGKWIIGYDHIPEPIEGTFQSRVFLFSSNGKSKKLSIDLTKLIEEVHSMDCPTCYPQDWKIKWINNQIIEVSVGFAETYQGLRPRSYHQAYFDVYNEEWIPIILKNAPLGDNPLWINLSPDLRYILYVDQEGILKLWGVEDQEIILKIPLGIMGRQVYPIVSWSSDSEKIVIWITEGDQAINQVTQLFYLSQPDKTIKKVVLYSEVRQVIPAQIFQWSADNKSLASIGWIRLSQDGLYQPVFNFFDSMQIKTKYTCAEKPVINAITVTDLFFSPNGGYLIYKSLSNLSINLQDLQTNTIYQLPFKDYVPVGWVKEFNFKQN